MPGDVRMTITETAPGELSLSGEIDAHTAPTFAERLGAVVTGRLVVDMSAVTFMDSSGLRVLVEFHQRNADGGPTLIIARPSRPIVRLLELTGLDEQFHVDPA